MPAAPIQMMLDTELVERARVKASFYGTTVDRIVSDLIFQWIGSWQPPADAPVTTPSPTPSTPPISSPTTGPATAPVTSPPTTPAASTPPAAGSPAPASKPEPRVHVVKNGDSLWKLAAKYYGDGDKYMLIARENDIHAGRRLLPGMHLVIPPEPMAPGMGILPNANVAPRPGYPIVPDGLTKLKEVFGGFTYTEIRGKPVGRIQINAQWLANHIVRTQVPGLGTIQCHKLLAPVFVQVFRELEAQKLTIGLKYDGCFVSRHKMWNPARELSVHSWGIAIDLNADSNPVGTAGKVDVRLITTFAKHGFYWGGNFGDPMHFQYCLNY